MANPWKWSEITSNPKDVKRLGKAICHLHDSHGARYGRHSMHSLTKFMGERVYDRVVGGKILSYAPTPRVRIFTNEVQDKEMSAFYFIRPTKPTPSETIQGIWEQNPPLAYCLTLAAPKKFPTPGGGGAAAAVDPAIQEMFDTINANCWDVYTQTGLPIEVICDVGSLTSDGYPTSNTLLQQVWDLALQLTTSTDPSTPYLHAVDGTYTAEEPYPQGTEVYRWNLVPTQPPP